MEQTAAKINTPPAFRARPAESLRPVMALAKSPVGGNRCDGTTVRGDMHARGLHGILCKYIGVTIDDLPANAHPSRAP